MEHLELSLLSRADVEIGKIWSVVLPLAVAALVCALGLASLVMFSGPWNPSRAVIDSGRPSVAPTLFLVVLGWLLFVSHVHFTALMAIGGLSDLRTKTWASVGVTVLCSIGIDLVLVGLLVKPVFLALSRDALD